MNDNVVLPKYLYIGVGITPTARFEAIASECERGVYNYMNDLFEEGLITDFVVRKIITRRKEE